MVRVGQELFEELKHVHFHPVVQKAMEKRIDVFRHLHSLSLGFHLNRSMERHKITTGRQGAGLPLS
jgi:ABC-type transport system involved in Fe-S cluster assembly fused permease/ATPase subunit